jgi:uncharacterized repeat protein (TIGR03803 family)
MTIEGPVLGTPAKLFALALLLAFACAAASPADARSYKFRVLYSFCSQSSCADGAEPVASLLMDHAGNLYGTTLLGGQPPQNGGTVFELTPGDRQNWRHKVLYSFCSQPNCADGSYPWSALIVDTSGNLYGTASGGGLNNGGVAFKLRPKATGKNWTYKLLYAFCAGGNECQDGATPRGGLTYAGASSGTPYDGISSLFGAAAQGGNPGEGGFLGPGVLYRLTPRRTTFDETTLYKFCSKTNCRDGGALYAPLLSDSQGNLFGIGDAGGNNAADDGGIIKWDTTQETLIYTFCSQRHCADGDGSSAPLIFDASHNLLGTTAQGGAHQHGVLFFFDGTETVLHNFCSVIDDAGACADGEEPLGGLLLDASGNLFGTASGGGAGAYGTGGVVFRYNDGETVLYNFCSRPNCADGTGPAASLIMDASGNLYGTTEGGGASGEGTVFELSPI